MADMPIEEMQKSTIKLVHENGNYKVSDNMDNRDDYSQEKATESEADVKADRGETVAFKEESNAIKEIKYNTVHQPHNDKYIE